MRFGFRLFTTVLILQVNPFGWEKISRIKEMMLRVWLGIQREGELEDKLQRLWYP